MIDAYPSLVYIYTYVVTYDLVCTAVLQTFAKLTKWSACLNCADTSTNVKRGVAMGVQILRVLQKAEGPLCICVYIRIYSIYLMFILHIYIICIYVKSV